MSDEILLTERQKQILNYIRSSIRECGYPPSVREICKAVGLSSTSTVHMHLNSLERLGLLQRDASKPRALQLCDNEPLFNKTMVPISVVGRVTAGQPILAVENIEDIFPLPLDLIGSHENVFMLTVSGDSMINAGIFDGDYIFVKRQQHAQNGDIVVAMLENDEATVKRFYKEANYIRLQPENHNMEPIIAYNVIILGKVIAVFRKL